MVGERGLAALLYRADWARLCLSGEMRGLDESLISAMSHMMPNGPGRLRNRPACAPYVIFCEAALPRPRLSLA